MTFGSNMSYSSSKARVSALEKLKQSNAAKLELETRKMEERIRSLKEKMIKEKEERERQGGTRWANGRTGPLTTSYQKPKKTSPKERVAKAPRRIKVLNDEPISNYMRKPNPGYTNQEETNRCGQCETNSSVWVCRECSENYCDACFNQFHQKGALKKHTKTRVEEGNIGKSQNEKPSTSSVKKDNHSLVRSYGETTNSPLQTNGLDNSQSLLNGSYNEEESAASFAKALQEWREQGQISKNTPRIHATCADTSCGTSNELVDVGNNKKELQISFHNSMSYGDRLFLKKGRQDPSIIVRELPTSVKNNDDKRTRPEEDNCNVTEGNTTESGKTEDLYSPNYREMIQNLTKSNKDDTTSCQVENSLENNVSIIEVSATALNDDSEETTCIVEEYDTSTETTTRPASHHGRLSIQEMLSTGDFSEPNPSNSVINSTLESPRYVSPSLTSKPFSLTLSTKKKQPKPPNSAGKPNKKRPVDYNGQPKKTPHLPVYQAWRPKPVHKDMSEFFLAGVEGSNERENTSPVRGDNGEVCSTTEFSLSKGNLPITWHPQDSYLPESPSPPREKQLPMSTQTGLEKLQSKENNSSRESTALEVSHEPTVTRGSDENEDEIPVVDIDDFGTGDQDDDDRATLHDLEWELASSTGRLTRCDQDILDLEQSDDDSIEDKDGGSGLSTPRTLQASPSFHESIMDDFEEMERRFMEEEF